MTERHDTWACSLPLVDAARAADLRTAADFQVAIVNDRLWLKGKMSDASLLQRLSTITDESVFLVNAQGQLTPIRQTVPTERLPQVEWQASTTFFAPVLPVAGIPHGSIAQCRLQLIRSCAERPADLLLCPASAFKTWAVTAPAIRLQHLQFAACRSVDVRVLCVGRPLPAVAGSLFWLAGQVAVPLGCTWHPDLDVATLNEVLFSTLDRDLTPGAILLWTSSETDQSVEFISASSFIPVTRSSVRNLN